MEIYCIIIIFSLKTGRLAHPIQERPLGKSNSNQDLGFWEITLIKTKPGQGQGERVVKIWRRYLV